MCKQKCGCYRSVVTLTYKILASHNPQRVRANNVVDENATSSRRSIFTPYTLQVSIIISTTVFSLLLFIFLILYCLGNSDMVRSHRRAHEAALVQGGRRRAQAVRQIRTSESLLSAASGRHVCGLEVWLDGAVWLACARRRALAVYGPSGGVHRQAASLADGCRARHAAALAGQLRGEPRHLATTPRQGQAVHEQRSSQHSGKQTHKHTQPKRLAVPH